MEELSKNAADHLAKHRAEDLPEQKARERLLALLIGNHVADMRHGKRNDRRGSDAAEEAQHADRGQGVGPGDTRGAEARQGRGQHDHPQLAEAIA
jgi:hypothetical protein